MKELTIEEKYELALEKAMKLYERGTITESLSYLFPELKENEDEKIRKKLISFVENWNKGGIFSKYTSNANDIKRILAWLEKQGERKEATCVADIIDRLSDKEQDILFKELEIQKEQKSAEKVKSKFKVGDWVIDKSFGSIKQIKHFDNDEKVWFTDGTGTFIELLEGYRLWTIKDAKPGDVLFHSDSASNGIFIFKEIIDKGFAKEIICYCDYDSEDHFCLGEHHTCCWTDAKILYPATKEQRDALEKAMADAGYIFNFEKKELKKLGQSEVTKTSDQEEIAEIPFGTKDSELQEATYYIPKGFHAEINDDKVVIKKGEKPTAWTEEDNMMIEETLYFLREYHHSNRCKNEGDMQKSVTCREWLKSLKQRIGG